MTGTEEEPFQLGQWLWGSREHLGGGLSSMSPDAAAKPNAGLFTPDPQSSGQPARSMFYCLICRMQSLGPQRLGFFGEHFWGVILQVGRFGLPGRITEDCREAAFGRAMRAVLMELEAVRPGVQEAVNASLPAGGSHH